MKLKDIISTFIVGFTVVWLIQMLFGRWMGTQQGAVTPRTFIAPQDAQAVRPLNKEIDFFDEKKIGKEIKTDVDTKWGHLVFTTNGASLDRLEFKRNVNKKTQTINTVFPVGIEEREKSCFLVALQEKTPYFYQFMGKDEHDKSIHLRYYAETDVVTIDKEFIIDTTLPTIDIVVTVNPKQVDDAVEIRIFYPSPLMSELSQDAIYGIVESQGEFERITRDKIEAQKGWFAPTLFGADDRYFIHSMVGDQNNFAKRAYYKFEGKSALTAILEGSTVKEKSTWQVSFYMGPKETSLMEKVDPRLEKTLEYFGMLAPVSKFLLMILTFLYTFVGNYGLAIIILTVLIKVILLPFTFRADRGMKERVEFQKKLAYVQQKYKHDPALLAQERATLVRKYGMPGLGGCLPLLLQLPIFFALSRLLSSAIELFQAPFLWIPNLGAPDPFYILPLMVTIIMLVQAMMADQNQRFSIMAMALVFGAITASLSAGLALYIFMGTFLGVAQTWLFKHFKFIR